MFSPKLNESAGRGRNRTSPHSSHILTVLFLIVSVFSPDFGNMPPDRPRSVVPAVRHIKMIVLMFFTSSFTVIRMNSVTENMIITERAPILSKITPTHGLLTLRAIILPLLITMTILPLIRLSYEAHIPLRFIYLFGSRDSLAPLASFLQFSQFI